MYIHDRGASESIDASIDFIFCYRYIYIFCFIIFKKVEIFHKMFQILAIDARFALLELIIFTGELFWICENYDTI